MSKVILSDTLPLIEEKLGNSAKKILLHLKAGLQFWIRPDPVNSDPDLVLKPGSRLKKCSH